MNVNGRNGEDGLGFVQEGYFPQGLGRGAVGVEGIDAVVLGGDEEHVVFALTGNLDVGHIKGLSVSIAVDGKSKDFSKLFGINVLRVENFFVEICPGAGVVVLGGQHLCLGRSIREQRGQGHPGYQKRSASIHGNNLQ